MKKMTTTAIAITVFAVLGAIALGAWLWKRAKAMKARTDAPAAQPPVGQGGTPVNNATSDPTTVQQMRRVA